LLIDWRLWARLDGGGTRAAYALDSTRVPAANPSAPGRRIQAHLLDVNGSKQATGIPLQFRLLLFGIQSSHVAWRLRRCCEERCRDSDQQNG